MGRILTGRDGYRVYRVPGKQVRRALVQAGPRFNAQGGRGLAGEGRGQGGAVGRVDERGCVSVGRLGRRELVGMQGRRLATKEE